MPQIITSCVFISSAQLLTYDLKPFSMPSAPVLIRMVFLSGDKLNRLSQAVLSVLILKFWDTGNFNHVSSDAFRYEIKFDFFSGNIVSVGVFDDPVFMGTVVCNHSMNRNGDIEFFFY